MSDPIYPGAEYVGKLVGFIVMTRGVGYLPFVGLVTDSPGDRDAFVYVRARQPRVDTLELALGCFDNGGDEGLAHVFRQPVKAAELGMATWMSELMQAETRAGEAVEA